MKTHKDLLTVLRSNGMRITPGRRVLIQFVLDHHKRQIPLREIQIHLERNVKGFDRSTLYRNLEALKKLEIIQELVLPSVGKCFQYVFDKKVRHFFICKRCGKSQKGNEELFRKIEKALKDVHGFSKANLSLVFYGLCSSCTKRIG